jgi:energy-coupling factor transporter ATP-binding protein EcfA2
MFEELGNEMAIEDLSSGEKQIVFRGSFLLRDQQSTKGSVVLLDEPELSLHPTWQIKILDFYKRLFQDETGQQTSQIFVATHSPFIIHNDRRANDKVIVLARYKNGKIYVKQEPKYIGWTRNKVVEEAFNLSLFENSELPIVLVEGDYDVKYIRRAAEFLNKTALLSKLTLTDGDGFGNLDKVWSNHTHILSKILKQDMLLLYDCDTQKPNDKKGKVFKRVIPTVKNQHIKKGIENLFPNSLIEKAIQHKKAFIDIDRGTKIMRGEETEYTNYQVNKDEKKNLCDWICENATAEDFCQFEAIFKIIENIFPNESISQT